MRRLAAFARLTRPPFLLGGALGFGLGAALARDQCTAIAWSQYALGQALVTAVQLTAQYANEYFDAEGDRPAARTPFSGGSGVLPAGLLPRRFALRAAQGTTLAALALTTVVAFTSAPAALLGVGALAGAWAYSAPPLRLAGSGGGEIVASVIVGALVPLAGLWVHGGRVDAGFGWMAAALVATHFALIVALAVPDRAADHTSGKRTLVVRMGVERVRPLHLAALGAAATAVGGGTIAGALPAETAVAALATTPLAAVQVAALRRDATWLTTAAVVTFAALTSAFLVATLAW